MKKILSKLCTMDKISVKYIRMSLLAVTLCAVSLALYCAVLYCRGCFYLKIAQSAKSSLEYIAASASLGVCFGFLIDLAVKKSGKC